MVSVQPGRPRIAADPHLSGIYPVFIRQHFPAEPVVGPDPPRFHVRQQPVALFTSKAP